MIYLSLSVSFVIIAIALLCAHPISASHNQTRVLASYEDFQDLYCRSDAYDCCKIEGGERCPISHMKLDKSTLVSPGGESRCIFSYSKPYAFQVMRGAKDKVVIFLQGGGSCWDEHTSSVEAQCSINVKPANQQGIYARGEKASSKFGSFTTVGVLYCSGDNHAGNAQRSYNDRAGKPVEQRGLRNLGSVLQWIIEQQESGYMSDPLSELVITGASAGAISAQVVSKKILQTLRWERAAVIPDSHIGLIPPGSFGKMYRDFGYCDSGMLDEKLVDVCKKGTLDMKDVVLQFAAEYPNVPFAYIQSKEDITQQRGYEMQSRAMRGEYLAVDKSDSSGYSMSPAEFYERANEVFALYSARLSNVVAYMINGDHHVFTSTGYINSADAFSPEGSNYKGMKLKNWIEQLPLHSGESISSVCIGPIRTASSLGHLIEPPAQALRRKLNGGNHSNEAHRILSGESEDDRYCLKELMSQKYTQQ